MAWETTGNSGTTPPTDFLGTTDSQPLVIKINNTEAVRINAGDGPTSKVEIVAQDGLAISGFQPFLTLRDANAGNARSVVQGVDGDIVLIPNSFIGGGAAMVLKTGSGNVGIGTSDPTSKVEIIAQDGLAISGFQPFLTLRDANAGNARSVVQGVDGDIVLIPNSFIGGGAAMVLKTGSGNVGIGTSDPTSKVEIIAQDGLAISGFQPFLTLRDANAGSARSVVQGVDGDIVLIPNSFIGGGAAMVLKTGSGNVGIGTSTPTDKLHVAGTVRADDVVLSNGDCAEDFDVDTAVSVKPGTVMVLRGDGSLEPSQQAYDKRVAGVISGAGDYKPGILLDKQYSQPNRKPIALLGKVYCKVDAGYAPIEVGDLLTTSDTPGHAMKATDPLSAFGATIGKALRPLREGQGLIPILIALG